MLRVDSPGGSSVASDVMWRELMITRDQKPSRPLITSMSDLAASGGYYISVPGQVIVAQPGTLTGSIGIFAGKIVIDGTLAKIGITTETLAIFCRTARRLFRRDNIIALSYASRHPDQGQLTGR